MDDQEGFAVFVTTRGPALLRFGWLLTADPDAAEDLAQEALARFVRHWDRVSGTGNPEAYVRASMRSIWIDQWRRRHGWSVAATAELPERAVPDEALEAVPSRQAVVDALARLAPRQRAVLVLRFYEDLTEAATAKALGCSVSTVKSQTREALARLRALAPWLAEELGQVNNPVDGEEPAGRRPQGRVALRSVGATDDIQEVAP